MTTAGPTQSSGLLVSGPDVLFLYAAAFFMAFGSGQWWLALPFIVNLFGGSDSQVGLCLAANMGVYALSVLAAARLLERFDPKRILQFGAGSTTAITAVMCLIVVLTVRQVALGSSVGLLIGTSALFGVSMAAFWPPLMSWLSAGCGSPLLNRRLSRFSVSWSLGSLLSPYVSGCLTEWSPILPIAASAGMLSLCFLAVSRPPRPAEPAGSSSSPEGQTAVTGHRPAMVWLARLALFGAFVGFGLARTQFAVYFKRGLGYSESGYGLFVTILSLTMFLVYGLVGRTDRWQYRPGLLLAAPGMVLAFLVVALYATSLAPLFLSAALLGAGTAFCYSSHLYYGAAGGLRRFRLMAIHEFVLSTGFVAGAWVGGLLSDRYHRQAPYQFGAVLLAAVIAGQIILLAAQRLGRKRPQKYPESMAQTE
ncbi:MAG: MFS transporter [Sedimentisphaerales bacterium]|nr:MFS transporter [Sedimentisphaerales bacterium]